MEHHKRKHTGDRFSVSPEHTDRLAALPDSIIHHILSFLPYKDVIVTSSLSKTLYRISTSFPYFDFDDSLFKQYFKPWGHISATFDSNISPLNQSCPYFDLQNPSFHQSFEPCVHDIDKYLIYVSKTLRRFHKLNLQIERLSIPITFSPRVARYLDYWILLALQQRVQELNLIIRNNGDNKSCYDLPRLVFPAKSIKEVKLYGCSLLKSFVSGSSSNLLKLHLDCVLLDDFVFSSIISTCPLIEELSILSCVGIKCLRVCNLKNLRTFRISYECFEKKPEMVEIDAPSLQSLDIRALIKIGVLECPKLTHMSLDYAVLDDFRLQDFLSRLPFLRSLSFSNMFSLTKLKISSDTLNKFRVLRCNNLVELKIDAPNLQSFNHNGECSLLPLSMHKVICRWYGYNGWVNPYAVNPILVEDFLVMLRNFTSKAKHLDNLLLYLRGVQTFSFEELNKRSVLPLVTIKHLQLYVINYVPKINYLDLLDCLLWSCHPQTLSLHLDYNPFRNDNNNFAKRIFEAIIYRPRFSPCKLARSWLHCLEDVMYVTEDGKEDRIPMDEMSAPYLCRSYSEIKFIFKW